MDQSVFEFSSFGNGKRLLILLHLYHISIFIVDCWLILILLDPKIQMDLSFLDLCAGSQGGRTSDPSSGEDGRRQFGTVSSHCFHCFDCAGMMLMATKATIGSLACKE